MKKINGEMHLEPIEVAEKYGVVISAVYWWLKQKKCLPYKKVGGRIYILQSDLQNFTKPRRDKMVRTVKSDS